MAKPSVFKNSELTLKRYSKTRFNASLAIVATYCELSIDMIASRKIGFSES